MGTDINCDLEPVEKRLMDSFHLWMKLSDKYFSPDEFRINLNSTIQELRNITFILQKNKGFIKNFDDWYSNWQSKMRMDKILKWLVESRNKIVKEGDLETDSIAKVSIIYNWFEPPVKEFSVQPFFNSKEITEFVLKTISENEIPRNSILKVERQWIESSLKEIELLEALIHCFDMYAALIYDAHKYINNVSCPYLTFYEKEIKNIKKDYSLGKDTYLVTYYDLTTKESIAPKLIEHTPTEDDFKTIEEHYDFLKKFEHPKSKNTTLKEEAELKFEFAKNILAADGYHLPTVILSDEDGKKEVHQLRLENKRDTFLTFRKIAKVIEANKYTRAICIGESWVAIADENHPEWLPGDYPNKKEALLVVAIEKDGEEISITSVFTREGDKIIFGTKQLIKEANSYFLNPIKDVWKGAT